GETSGYTFGPFESSVQIICSVPGHAAAGMVTEVVVTDEAAGAPSEGHGAASGGEAAEIDPNATPSDGWERRDPAVAPAEDGEGTVHQITFSMTETDIEIAP